MMKPRQSGSAGLLARTHTDVSRTGGNRRSGDYPRGADALLPASGAAKRPTPRLGAAPGAEYIVLAHLVREFAHLLGEHQRMKPSAERPRRRLEARLHAAEAEFEHLLGEWFASIEERTAWREALHGRAPVPGNGDPPVSFLIFRGRTADGVEVDVLLRGDGETEIDLDGCPSERVVDRVHLVVDADGWAEIADLRARETFDAPAGARRALRAWGRRGGTPPWEHVLHLLADGLIDERFAMTPRGRRLLGRTCS